MTGLLVRKFACSMALGLLELNFGEYAHRQLGLHGPVLGLLLSYLGEPLHSNCGEGFVWLSHGGEQPLSHSPKPNLHRRAGCVAERRGHSAAHAAFLGPYAAAALCGSAYGSCGESIAGDCMLVAQHSTTQRMPYHSCRVEPDNKCALPPSQQLAWGRVRSLAMLMPVLACLSVAGSTFSTLTSAEVRTEACGPLLQRFPYVKTC
jgi:hypothetical protein